MVKELPDQVRARIDFEILSLRLNQPPGQNCDERTKEWLCHSFKLQVLPVGNRELELKGAFPQLVDGYRNLVSTQLRGRRVHLLFLPPLLAESIVGVPAGRGTLFERAEPLRQEIERVSGAGVQLVDGQARGWMLELHVRQETAAWLAAAALLLHELLIRLKPSVQPSVKLEPAVKLELRAAGSAAAAASTDSGAVASSSHPMRARTPTPPISPNAPLPAAPPAAPTAALPDASPAAPSAAPPAVSPAASSAPSQPLDYEQLVGKDVEVYWPEEEKWFAGEAKEYDSEWDAITVYFFDEPDKGYVYKRSGDFDIRVAENKPVLKKNARVKVKWLNNVSPAGACRTPCSCCTFFPGTVEWLGNELNSKNVVAQKVRPHKKNPFVQPPQMCLAASSRVFLLRLLLPPHSTRPYADGGAL